MRDADGLRRAVRDAKPGQTLRLAAGDYGSGFFFEGLKGAAGKPVVIAAADPKDPPVFRGGACAIHFVDAAHVELRDLAVTGATANGLNFDDGGSYDTPSHHVTIRGVRFTDIGAKGNEDALKLSGLDDFTVADCTFERWGSGGGSAIDMVGCHRGTIEGCTFRHKEAANAVQAKGGCATVTVRGCRFDDAGSRAVNVGGSTGLEFFRPKLADPPFSEARDIRVEGNTFIGSDAPVAFVGSEDCIVRFNTIWHPRRWAMRILQETRSEGFVPCRRGTFADNIVVFESKGWSEGGVNTGPGTEPATFKFERNAWFCEDDPARSKPKLPAAEKDGRHGVDPGFVDPAKGDLRLKPESALKSFGAEAFPR